MVVLKNQFIFVFCFFVLVLFCSVSLLFFRFICVSTQNKRFVALFAYEWLVLVVGTWILRLILFFFFFYFQK